MCVLRLTLCVYYINLVVLFFRGMNTRPPALDRPLLAVAALN